MSNAHDYNPFWGLYGFSGTDRRSTELYSQPKLHGVFRHFEKKNLSITTSAEFTSAGELMIRLFHIVTRKHQQTSANFGGTRRRSRCGCPDDDTGCQSKQLSNQKMLFKFDFKFSTDPGNRHTHMDCTVEADGLLSMDESSCGCKARFLMSRCEGMMDKPTLRYEQLACGKLFCPVVPRCVHPRTPQLQLCT